MSDKYFLDTNILVYSLDPTFPSKRRRSRELITEGTTTRLGVISYQVIQEFVNVAVSKFQIAISRADLDDLLRRVLFPIMTVSSSPSLFLDALHLQGSHQLSWYDSLIVAAAIQGKCDVLYSEDLQHGHQFGALVVENPFR